MASFNMDRVNASLPDVLQANLLKRRKVTVADEGRPFMGRDKIPLG